MYNVIHYIEIRKIAQRQLLFPKVTIWSNIFLIVELKISLTEWIRKRLDSPVRSGFGL